MRLVSYLFCRSRMFEVQCPLEFFFSTPSNFQFKSVEVVFRVKKMKTRMREGKMQFELSLSARTKYFYSRFVLLGSHAFRANTFIESDHASWDKIS